MHRGLETTPALATIRRKGVEFSGRLRLSVLVVLGSLSAISFGAERVQNEVTRQQVLAVLFPGMKITQNQGTTIDSSWRVSGQVNVPEFPDAFKAEPVYVIRGTPSNELERCAAEDLSEERPASSERELRFLLHGLRRAARSYVYVGVIQYRFIGAKPAMSCSSIARFALLTRSDEGWRLRDEFYPDTTHQAESSPSVSQIPTGMASRNSLWNRIGAAVVGMQPV